jgi:GTP-binding protein HflX
MNSNIEINEKDSRALLVGVDCRSNDDVEAMLDELERLADTAGIVTVGKVIQNRQNPDPATYIGSGKAEELSDSCKINNVGLVIFDDELSPSQIKNLEEVFGGDVRVIDRSMLILDIFALHATTNEGKIQVELAQLQYTSPRLIGKGTQLSRQQGGNIAMRGPGETKLETDRRHLKRRMAALREQLAEIEKNRATMRGRRDRSGIKQIAIAGYTNAGKSTLTNYLTGAGILAEDKLFATLDPTTRRYSLPCGEEILLTDTVGFIRNLPHHLVEAFKSTLDEVKYADIVVVLIDASDPEYLSHTAVTRELLLQLDAASKPVLYVFNKCDRQAFEIPRLMDIPASDAIYISAKTGQGVDKLVSRLEELVLDGKRMITLRIPNAKQGALNTAYSFATVVDVEYGDEYVTAKVIADERARGMLREYTVN